VAMFLQLNARGKYNKLLKRISRSFLFSRSETAFAKRFVVDKWFRESVFGVITEDRACYTYSFMQPADVPCRRP